MIPPFLRFLKESFYAMILQLKDYFARLSGNLRFIFGLENSLGFKLAYLAERFLWKVEHFLGISDPAPIFLRKDYVLKTKNFAWQIKPGSDFDRVVGPTFEKELEPYFSCKGVFIDVGAHVGRWTFFVARTASVVLAFEAHPETYRYLASNKVMNHVENAEVFNVALSDAEKRVRFDARELSHASISGISERGNIEIEAKPLDSFTEEIPEIELLKIDAESHELHVLQGARKTLRKTRRIICEINGESDRRKVIDFLRSFGFTRVEKLPDEADFYFTK